MNTNNCMGMFNDFCRQMSQSTRISYRSIITEFETLIEKATKDATIDDCEKYLDYLEKRTLDGTLKRSTKIKKCKILSSYFSFIIRNASKYEIKDVPTNLFKDKLEDKEEGISFSKTRNLTDIDIILENSKEDYPMVYICVAMAHKCLLRTSEILNIRLSDIYYLEDDTCVISILDARSKKLRYLHMTKDFTEFLDAFIEEYDTNRIYLIEKGDGKPYAVRTVQKYLRDICIANHIEPFTFNDLRNMGIANALQNEMPIPDLMDAIGMVTSRHKQRLTNLKLPYSEAGKYINIELKTKK